MIDPHIIHDRFQALRGNLEQYIRSDSFVLSHAQTALNEWKEYRLPEELSNTILQAGGNGYQFLKQRIDAGDPDAQELKSRLFMLIAYCDAKAADKAHYNRYNDSRTIAHAGVRQNAWIIQWIKYKKEGPSAITDTIKNTLLYIQNPDRRFPILSERHREAICSAFLQKPYDKDSFDEELLRFFTDLQLAAFANPANATYAYTRLLYDGLKQEWQAVGDIQGVFVRDNTPWKEIFVNKMDSASYCILWWSKHIVNYKKVYPILQKIVDNGGSFDYYIAENGKAAYKANVVDFAAANEYAHKRDAWKEKKPVDFTYDFSEYTDESKKATIAFLCDSFEKLESPIAITDFITYDQAALPVQNNMVAFTRISSQHSKQMEQFISDTAALALRKKNIILQGAPGTGKTFSTAAIALKILGIPDIDYTNHQAVMNTYGDLLNSRIFFTTFHQSMDYSDFVEGLRPVVEQENVVYRIEPGIFKRACPSGTESVQEPRVLIIDEINRGNISKIFGELISNIDSDKRLGALHPLKIQLPYSKESFGVPDNLYIIGTMNTTDRSVGNIDYALRRRFAFVTVSSRREVIEQHYPKNTELQSIALDCYDKIAEFIDSTELMIGHSYFLADSKEELYEKLRYEIIPLLTEYWNDGILTATRDELRRLFDELKKSVLCRP